MQIYSFWLCVLLQIFFFNMDLFCSAHLSYSNWQKRVSLFSFGPVIHYILKPFFIFLIRCILKVIYLAFFPTCTIRIQMEVISFSLSKSHDIDMISITFWFCVSILKLKNGYFEYFYWNDSGWFKTHALTNI